MTSLLTCENLAIVFLVIAVVATHFNHKLNGLPGAFETAKLKFTGKKSEWQMYKDLWKNKRAFWGQMIICIVALAIWIPCFFM